MSDRIPNPYRLHGLNMPDRVCYMLEAALGAELAALRTRARGVDPEVAYVLLALREAALTFVPPEEHEVSESEEQPRESVAWISTTQAAERLGITRRAIGQAITRDRLAATRVGRNWRIRRSDLDNYHTKASNPCRR